MTLQAMKRVLSRVPIRWKLTLGAAFLIFVLFIAYNSAQYVVVEKWMIAQEKTDTRQKMSQILNELLEKESGFTEAELPQLRSYLDKKNESDELIRIVDQQGNGVITVSNGIPEEWIAPSPKGKTEIAITEYSGHSLLVMRSPLTIYSFHGTVEIVKNMDQFKQLTEAILRLFLLTGLGAVVLSGLGGGLLARQLLKPLQSMAQTIRNVEQKGLQERMVLPGTEDEIATLMKMFNGMMDQVERSFHQQSQFVEDASHELRTPIAIMDGHLSLLLRWGKNDPAALEESLNISYHELTRLKALVQDLLLLTREEKDSDTADERTQRADRTMLSLIGQWEELHPEYTFETAFVGLADWEIVVSEGHLEQILMILLDNAVKYSEPGSAVRVAGSVRDGAAFIEVADCGIGIAEQDLPLVTDRFYRVDKARSRQQGGTGLGLAIAKRLVERYNGSMTIRSKVAAGTTATISLACRPYIEKREVDSSEGAD
ncbi:HAMP domain-containing sensor histidine kinase [Paenibacillus herberti]|uniref:Signal transduction histidine-protein kinase ArlS n=1 Tax=Paenibacillus herberti TaxID=1619309 RepID=A0A229P1R5_9BACL|nr:HAMP domain-containing histidine kinase [Paenibacillus herberti]OXM15904.1 histidine kinase [Paenibacillus herberti]